MNVLGWKSWYSNGQVFYFGEALPEEGCIGFVVYYAERVTPNGPHYRDLVISGDWYLIKANGTVKAFGERQDGTWAAPPPVEPGEQLIRSAKTLPDEEWSRISAEMMGATAWL